MSTVETFVDGAFTVELREAADAIDLHFLGRSRARQPGKFLLPILTGVLERSHGQGKPIVLDFREIEYMNSSTLSPIIRMLQLAKRGQSTVRVLYRKDLKWQYVNFNALDVFHTDDDRIAILGL